MFRGNQASLRSAVSSGSLREQRLIDITPKTS
jgi:hypothetical protein